MKKFLVLLFILLNSYNSSAYVGGSDFTPNKIEFVVDRLNCIYSRSTNGTLSLTNIDKIEQFYILLPSAGLNEINQRETFSFSFDVINNNVTDLAENRIKGQLTVEDDDFGILLSGHVELYNPFLNERETVIHKWPSLYVEDFFYLTNRARDPSKPMFRDDFNRSNDKIGGGLTCFPETVYIYQNFKPLNEAGFRYRDLRLIETTLIEKN